jgi:hypothetical protein
MKISHLFGADADWARRNAYSMSQGHALTIHLNTKTKVVITSFLYFIYSSSVIIIPVQAGGGPGPAGNHATQPAACQ